MIPAIVVHVDDLPIVITEAAVGAVRGDGTEREAAARLVSALADVGDIEIGARHTLEVAGVEMVASVQMLPVSARRIEAVPVLQLADETGVITCSGRRLDDEPATARWLQ